MKRDAVVERVIALQQEMPKPPEGSFPSCNQLIALVGARTMA